MPKLIRLLPVETSDITGVALAIRPEGIVLDISYQVRSDEARVYKSAAQTVTIAYDDGRPLALLVTAALNAINTAEGLTA